MEPATATANPTPQDTPEVQDEAPESRSLAVDTSAHPHIDPSNPIHRIGKAYLHGKRGINKTALYRRQIIEKVIGKPGSQEEQEIISDLRRKLLAGSLPEGIMKFLLEHWMGKPKENIALDVSGQLEHNHNVSKIVREIVDPAKDTVDAEVVPQ